MAGRIEKTDGLSTRSEQAYQTVRAMIIEGRLGVGQWIRRRNLAAQLNMSPTPLADAFRRLEQEGLLEYVPLWGVRVRSYTVSELEQLYQIRAALEQLIVRECCRTLADSQVDELRSLAIGLDDAIASMAPTESTDQRPLMERDFGFHRRMAELSGLNLVAHELERNRLLRMTVRVFQSYRTPAVPHVEIVEAIASRNTQRADEVIQRHTLTAINAYAPELRRKFGDQPISISVIDQAPAVP